MTPFDYLSVLLSIVLGLAITQLLGGFASMVRARERIAFYWPLHVQQFAVFLICVQVWWAFFGMRGMADWNFAGFFVVVLQPVTLYLMAAFATPDIPPGERVDLRAFYFREQRWFFGAILAALAVSLIKDYLVLPGPVAVADLAGHLVFAALALCGFFLRGDRAHKIIAPLSLAMYAAYIALLFVTLPD